MHLLVQRDPFRIHFWTDPRIQLLAVTTILSLLVQPDCCKIAIMVNDSPDSLPALVDAVGA